MNKDTLLIFLFLCTFQGLSAQPGTRWALPDAVARAAPDSVEISVSALSGYFGTQLQTEQDLVRAFYVWTATEIDYDARSLYDFRSSGEQSEIIRRTLESRRAVCQGYAAVFHALCAAAGIESYIVPGYSRQQGKVVAINHAWIMARIEGSWYGFDPTWGSGLILDGRYVRRFTSTYFMSPPELFITTHMPFDPLWQCLEHPVSAAEFARGNSPGRDGVGIFDFPDTLAVYNRLTKAGQYTAAIRRLEQSGVTNNSAREYHRWLVQSLEIEEANRQNELRNQQVAIYNNAVNHYNTASLLFNKYISYWNHQFRPVKPDGVIRGMLDTCSFHLAASRNLLKKVNDPDESISQNKELLIRALAGNQRHVDEQYAFLREYFGTPKPFRASLFGKITVK